MFSDYSKTPLNREEHKKIVRIIHNLLNMNQSVSFRKPVCYRALGLEDYKDVVKKPMDLNMIRRNNNEWGYKHVEEVFDDIQLCWDNCRRYNKPGSEIYECAVIMEQNFAEQIKKQYPSFQIPEGVFKGRETFPENSSTFVRVQNRQTKEKVVNYQSNNNQIYQQQNESQQANKDYVAAQRYQYKRPSKKQSKAVKLLQKAQQMQVYNYQQNEGEAQNFAEQMKQQQIEPLVVTLPEYPPQSSIIALGERIKQIKNQRDVLRGILRIIQEDQQQSVKQTGNIQFTFKASEMTLKTFIRIDRFLDVATKM